MKVMVIYRGGYVPDLGIMGDPSRGDFGWLVYRHPDGQWVTLADLKKHMDVILLADPAAAAASGEVAVENK